jgi:CRP-like cAMP-binding protein
MFAPLSSLMVERLASSLKRMNLETGAQVFRQGDVGDSFYIISDGEIETTVDGGATRTLRAGDYFGEIVLLRDVPRAGTATARSEVTPFALEGDDFVSVVTGTPTASRRPTR